MPREDRSETPTAGPPTPQGGPPEFHAKVLDSITDGIMVVDLSKTIVYVNDVLASFYASTPEQMTGKNCEELILFEHCASCPHQGVTTGEASYTGHNLHCELVDSGPFCVSASPYTDAEGNITGMVELYRDMRSLGAYIEDLEVERKRLDDILMDSSDGYYVADLDRRILRVDAKLADLLGVSPQSLIGKGCNEVFGSDKCDTDCPILWARDNRKNVIACREQIVAAEGAMPVDKSIFLQRDAKGEPLEVIGVIRNATEIVELRRTARESLKYKRLISRNRSMEEVFELIAMFGPTETSVLILGESGTGKELVASALQESSNRVDKPFLKINCSVLSEGLLASELFGHVRGAFTGADQDKRGKFEVADGGTLFLDEVGEMSPALQTKLLRVLEQQEFEPVGSTETRKVNVRIVAATNRDLLEEIRENRFRNDLYYRLNATQIKLPPLRRRAEDIPLLIEHFLKELNATYHRGVERISARALDVLSRYPWPGNIRELRNAINFAYVCATGNRIERRDLPEHIRTPDLASGLGGGHRAQSSNDERQEIEAAIERFEGNRNLVAKSLGVSRTTLWRRMRTLGIDA